MSIDGVWGEATTEVWCVYCNQGPHQVTHYKYSPNKKVTAHFGCRWCRATIQVELPGAIIKVEPPPRQPIA